MAKQGTEKIVHEFRASDIKINLLPGDVIRERLQNSKLTFVSRLSVAALLMLIFFTSATLALKISQNAQFGEAEQGVVSAQTKVSSLQTKGAQAVLLKKRLDSIRELWGGSSKVVSVFTLIISLIPADIQVSDMTVDKNGNMNFSLSSPSLLSIETFLSDLGDTNKNLGLISRVDLDGISLGKDSLYRFGLKIFTKTELDVTK